MARLIFQTKVAPKGCFNCSNESRHRGKVKYEPGKSFNYSCDAKPGVSGNCYMTEERPEHPVCEYWKKAN